MHERMFADTCAPACYTTCKARCSYRTASHICLKHSTYFFLLFFIRSGIRINLEAQYNVHIVINTKSSRCVFRWVMTK